MESCALWPEVEGACSSAAVVSVMDRTGSVQWGCERHAGEALGTVVGAKIAKVKDWEAARRLLQLPWNAA